MRIAVIVPTLDRASVLGRLLVHLDNQERPPDELIISASSPEHLPWVTPANYPVSTVVGARGLSAQRNQGLDAVLGRCDIVTFFDDDFLPARSYLAQLERYFAALDDVAAIMGHVAVDGARGTGLTVDEGLMALRAAEISTFRSQDPIDQPGTYGCNMSIRASAIGTMRFDERLVLYGWQEDIDFTAQLRDRGRVVKIPALFGVHLGVKAGRVSGVRFGYSQVVNPTYLIRKGTIPIGFALNLMARNVAANMLKSLWSEPHVDRRGRLKGNIIGAYHLMRGRVEPEYVLEL